MYGTEQIKVKNLRNSSGLLFVEELTWPYFNYLFSILIIKVRSRGTEFFI